MIVKAIILVVGMFLVIMTRKVESDFRESTFIGFSIFAVFLVLLVVIIILLIIPINSVAYLLLISFGVWGVVNATLFTIFLPKIIDIFARPNLTWAEYRKQRARQINSQGSYHGSGADSSTGELVERLSTMKLLDKKQGLVSLQAQEIDLASQLEEVKVAIKAFKASIKDHEKK